MNLNHRMIAWICIHYCCPSHNMWNFGLCRASKCGGFWTEAECLRIFGNEVCFFLMLGRCRTSRNAKWPMSRELEIKYLDCFHFWQWLQGASCHICHISNRPWALNWPWNVKSSNFLVVRASAESMGNSSKSGTNMAQKHGEIFIFMEPHHKSPVSTDDSFKLGVLVWRCKKKRSFPATFWGPYSPPEECGAEPSHGPLWISSCMVPAFHQQRLHRYHGRWTLWRPMRNEGGAWYGNVKGGCSDFCTKGRNCKVSVTRRQSLLQGFWRMNPLGQITFFQKSKNLCWFPSHLAKHTAVY